MFSRLLLLRHFTLAVRKMGGTHQDFYLETYRGKKMNIWKITDYDLFLNTVLKSTENEIENALSKDEKKKYYRSYYEINKKKGKRRIYAVNKGVILYKLQKNLAENFLNNIIIADDVYGFIKGYSYLDYLKRHISFSGNKNYIRLDIKNFFGSIKEELIRDVLSYYIETNGTLTESKKEKLLTYIVEIILYNNQVAQGAITSPVISNIVFRKLDLRIQKYCDKLEIVYTRYADDMLFSAYNNKVYSKFFLQRIAEIIGSKGFNLNFSKIVRMKKEISLNGYVVGTDIRLSRRKIEDISRILFTLETFKAKKEALDLKRLNKRIREEKKEDGDKFSNHEELINYLAGQRSFIISVLQKTEDEKFKRKADKLLTRIEENILYIYKM